MSPTTKTDVTFEHIGAARLYNGSVRIDVKTMQAVIPAGEIHRLTQNWPAPVYDISDVMKNADAAPVGKAWITRSGKAVMILINGVQFVSPLAQVKGISAGNENMRMSQRCARFLLLQQLPKEQRWPDDHYF